MKLSEKTLHEKEIYNGRIIRVHVDDVELENGARGMREVVEHPGGVCVAVLTGQNELIFVRQLRYPYKEVLLELPAGKLEPGEDPYAAMLREQLEETGTRGEHYIFLGNLYPTPGYCGEIIRLWACRAVEATGSSTWTRTNSSPMSASRWTRPWRWCWPMRSPTPRPRWVF